jgi:hypothetical protein
MTIWLARALGLQTSRGLASYLRLGARTFDLVIANARKALMANIECLLETSQRIYFSVGGDTTIGRFRT